jgi:transposase
MVTETSLDYPSQWATIEAVAQALGIGSAETLRRWMRSAESDAGLTPVHPRDDQAEIRRLRRENAELRRANEVLRATPQLFTVATTRPRRSS